MAEEFNNYLTSVTFTGSGQSITIVPPSNSSSTNVLHDSENPSAYAKGTRTISSTSQIHSIYLTKEVNSYISENIEANGSLVSIYIADTSKSPESKYYIAKCVKVLPNSSFYIEKTITLQTQDCIKLEYNDNTEATIYAVCSGVDLT